MRANYKICIKCGQPIVRISKREQFYGTSKISFSLKEKREYRAVTFEAPWSSTPAHYWDNQPMDDDAQDTMLIVKSRKYSTGNHKREYYVCDCGSYRWAHEFSKNSDPKTLVKFCRKKVMVRKRT